MDVDLANDAYRTQILSKLFPSHLRVLLVYQIFDKSKKYQLYLVSHYGISAKIHLSRFGFVFSPIIPFDFTVLSHFYVTNALFGFIFATKHIK